MDVYVVAWLVIVYNGGVLSMQSSLLQYFHTSRTRKRDATIFLRSGKEYRQLLMHEY